MQILVKSIGEILDDRLSLEERGILISTLLLKDVDPKITLAKMKVKLPFLKIKDSLIRLHELEFLKWSGYSHAIESKKNQETSPDIIEIIDFMNGLGDTKFEPTSKTNSTLVRQRLLETSKEDVKRVIANRYAEWKDDSLMFKHYCPTTIFRASKFEKYLAEVNRTGQGESFVKANLLKLEDGDEITYEISVELSDKDTYTVEMFGLESEKRINYGKSVKYGRDIKKVLAIQQRKIEDGYKKTTEIFYRKD